MKKIWFRKFYSYKEAEEFDTKYYADMSKQERLDIMQYLRDLYYKIKGDRNASRKGLRRVIRIIQ